jgi:hypothetical protein
MNTFALDKNYNQFNFAEISVAELEIISGGSGGSGSFNMEQCLAAVANGAASGAAAGAALSMAIPGLALPVGLMAGLIGGGIAGAAGACFG